MSKNQRQFIKSVEKFQKIAEKERARLQGLAEKSGKFSTLAEAHPALRQFADRISQKDRQLAEDVSWSEQFIAEAKAEFESAKSETAKDKADPVPDPNPA